jgi:ssDNA-binding Zn-finger/Zn-ribbon topoisomerase 1
MEKQTHTIGERVDKLCAVCSENRGHIVASVTKWGRISRVNCPKCGTRSTFKRDASAPAQNGALAKSGAPYNQAQTYRTGQGVLHPTFGLGEVTALIEPQKIDVLFSDRLRRLIHARAQ